MRSIRTRYTILTVCAIVVALGIATVIGVVSIKKLGNSDAEQMLSLMCSTEAKNLDSYFEDVENSVDTVSALVQKSLESTSPEQLDSQVERSRDLFGEIAYNTKGVRTYYFRIDPMISKTVKGFWYINQNGEGFKEHEVTDITQYDTNDTSKLVWFTVPKATGKGVWLPPYYTENLGALVISYNVPVYWKEQFVGVIGIEIDYKMLAQEVEHISIFESGHAFILDADSNIIYHPQMDSSQLYDQDAITVPDDLLSDNELIQYRYDGIDKEAVWQLLRNGMRLYITVPISEINIGWHEMIWKVLLVSFILLVLVSIIFLRFTGRLTKPLIELTEAAKQVDQGNYELDLSYDKDDELGILTKTFRQLIGHTKEHIGSLNKKVFVDQLTSIRNRAGYDHYIQEMQDQMDEHSREMEFAIGVFDCDNLKRMNDDYGHENGDKYLKATSNMICRVFQHSPVFRIGGDEFSVILQDEDFANMDELFSQLRRTEAEINKAVENPWEEMGITFGLAVYDPEKDTSVTDVARRADQIMYENKRLRKEGHAMSAEEEMAQGVSIAKYVIENIDQAIENKWIKVYYQPAVRSLTGALCSMESLARWDDPEHGFLMPDRFIGPLEKSRQIYKLDQYVVEQVCADLHDRILQGKPIVPVSINCSRLDFTLCDMLGVVEKAVARQGISKEYIHIEVTESMIASDETLMRRVIDDFKAAGYEVWMDDFGSAYSSLTLLKDYPFDLLKMDLNFMASFTDKSKQILRSIILMAKDMHMKTLAEGVETKEELEYLKEIGCEKIQGFYYGSPQPIDDMFAHMEEIHVPVETMEEGLFYEKACEHIKPTDAPLEIVEYDGDNFKTLYMNKAYKAQIFSDDPSLEEADQRIYHTPSPLQQKYHTFASKLIESWEEETFYYTGASNYLRFRAQVFAEKDGHYLMEGSLINLSMDEDRDKAKEMDLRLRELNQIFEVVHLIDIGNDRFIPQVGEYKFYSDYDLEDLGLRAKLEIIAEKRIHPEEKDAFEAFADIRTLPERIEKSEKGYISSVFNVLQKDGFYKPEEIILMPIPGSGGNEFLFCTKMYYEVEESEKS